MNPIALSKSPVLEYSPKDDSFLVLLTEDVANELRRVGVKPLIYTCQHTRTSLNAVWVSVRPNVEVPEALLCHNLDWVKCKPINCMPLEPNLLRDYLACGNVLIHQLTVVPKKWSNGHQSGVKLYVSRIVLA